MTVLREIYQIGFAQLVCTLAAVRRFTFPDRDGEFWLDKSPILNIEDDVPGVFLANNAGSKSAYLHTASNELRLQRHATGYGAAEAVPLSFDLRCPANTFAVYFDNGTSEVTWSMRATTVAIVRNDDADNLRIQIGPLGAADDATNLLHLVDYNAGDGSLYLSIYDGADSDTWLKAAWDAATNKAKIGVFGAAPVVQPAGASQAATVMGNADNEIGGLTISAAYSQAEVTALRDKCEELADDVRALHTLVHAMRTALVDTGWMKGSA